MQAGAKIGWALLALLALAALPACGGVPVPEDVTQTSSPNLESTLSLAASTDLAGMVSAIPDPTTPAPALTSTPTLTPLVTPASSPTSGPLVLEFGPWDHVLSLAWAPGGDLLAAGVGRKVYLYNPLDLSKPHILETGGWATGLSFSPSLEGSFPAGSLLAISLRDGSVQIWDTGTRPDGSQSRPICKLEVHRKGANQVAFSPDGLTMATTGNDAMVRLWDIPDLLEQGSCKLELKAEMIGGARSVPDIQYHPGGLNLASVDLALVRIREIASQRLVVTLRAEQMLRSIAFSPSGDLLASAGVGDQVLVWQVESGELLYSLRLSPALRSTSSAFVWEVVFSPGGDLLAVADNEGRILLWKVNGNSIDTGEDGYPWLTFDAHQRPVTCLSFSPDGNTLASGSLDASLRLWGIEEILGD
jgi:WD40 repeat protein